MEVITQDMVLNRPATAGEVPTHTADGTFWGPTAPEATLLGYVDGYQYVKTTSGSTLCRRPGRSFRMPYGPDLDSYNERP